MNRLSPLITRRVGRFAPQASYQTGQFEARSEESAFLDDVKLFALSWLGGLVFFWTYFS